VFDRRRGGRAGRFAFQQGYNEARKNIEKLTALFGKKNVYVELQRHCDPIEERRNQAAVRLAEALDLPLLATNGVRYARAPEREILDVFTCIRNHTSSKRPDGFSNATTNVISVRPQR